MKQSTVSVIKGMFLNQMPPRSCMEIVKILKQLGLLENIKQEGNKAAHVSTILNRLVKNRFLQYSDKKTDRGGHIYELKPKV